jgi:predicted SAM-dependent methyltransferase
MKLNLGCGDKKIEGWVNVDLFPACNPDMVVNLEHFPYPWEDNSVDKILLNHVLDHLGQLTEVYLKIIQELYRICKNGAIIHIRVPHPRHDDFIGDLTHVRPITKEGLSLFDKALNQKWIEQKWENTPLGVYLNVDFRIQKAEYSVEQKYLAKIESGELTQNDVFELMRERLNVCKQISIEWLCVKE